MIYDAISVVVPCYNEEQNIYRNLNKIKNHLEKNFKDFEIIVVNDGSTDGTVSEIEKFGKDCPCPCTIVNHGENKGKGWAVREGMLRAKFEVVMFLDADLAIPIEELNIFYDKIIEGYDVVIASRFVPGLIILKPVKWYRKIMEKVFRLLRILIINEWEVKDTQCGFKVFTADAARSIFTRLTVNRFAFDAEVIFLAKKFGYRVKELPIRLQNPQNSHINLLIDPINMFFDLIRIRLNNIRGVYKDVRIENQNK